MSLEKVFTDEDSYGNTITVNRNIRCKVCKACMIIEELGEGVVDTNLVSDGVEGFVCKNVIECQQNLAAEDTMVNVGIDKGSRSVTFSCPDFGEQEVSFNDLQKRR